MAFSRSYLQQAHGTSSTLHCQILASPIAAYLNAVRHISVQSESRKTGHAVGGSGVME